jgi:hypothetical protein
MKYETYEFSFEKRMSDGWPIGGSFNYTRLKGNYALSLNSQYSMSVFSSPNSFVNSYGDLPFSRPIMVRLYGSFVLPYDLMFSFIFQHQDGTPWGRTVSVRPPTAWAAANNVNVLAYSVKVEPPWTRWEQPSDNLDIKVVKDIALGPGKLGLSMDVFNLLGVYTITDIRNPGGNWFRRVPIRPRGPSRPGRRASPARAFLNSRSFIDSKTEEFCPKTGTAL